MESILQAIALMLVVVFASEVTAQGMVKINLVHSMTNLFG